LGRFPEAIETAHELDIHSKDSTLTKIAIEQVKAFQFQQALQTSTSAESRQATALALIGLGQYERGIETADLIPNDDRKAEAWGAIAAKLAQTGEARLSEEIFRRAIEGVELTYYQTDALKAIAASLAEAGQRDRSLEFFRRAVGLASSIEGEWYREEAVSGIAALMAGSGFIAESIKLARVVDIVTLKNDMLRSMAIGLAKTRRWQEAVDLAGLDFASDFKIEMLVVIAVEMLKAGNSESALALITEEDLAKRGSSDGICAIAIELAKSSLPLTAVETARRIANESTRTTALIAIAAEFAKPETTELCLTTLQEALETANSIFGSRTKEDAVLKIAWEAAKAGSGEFSRNLLAQNISGFKPVDRFYHKAEALGVIASGLAKAGFGDFAEEVFQRAIETTDSVTAAYDRASAFCAVASELAEAGQNNLSRLVFKRAIETAGSINDHKERSRVLLAAASRLAEQGHLDLAIEATPNDDWIHAGLIEIVVSQMARAGQFRAAIEKANSIKFIQPSIAALNVIAFESAKAGQRQLSDTAFHQAISKAAHMAIPCQRANLLTEIAATLIRADHRPWAAQLLTETTDLVVNAQTFPWEQAEALALIALEWANADKREVSDETFARAASLCTRLLEMGERASLIMVNALARAGKFQMAKDSAGMIQLEALRAEALGLVAAEEARAGFSQGSILTTRHIITDRDKHLVVVAAALANAKDRIAFKKLLIPSADYINASYGLCGILAGLYPQQAAGVAQMVLWEP